MTGTDRTTAARLVTPQEIAQAIGPEPQAVHNWARRHPADFPAPSFVAGRKVYPMAAIVAWLDQRRVPRDRLAAHEIHGTTYGDRFRSYYMLPPGEPAKPGVRHETVQRRAAQAEAVLDANLWRPLLGRWQAAGLGSRLELLLFLLYLRGRDEKRWGELAAARPTDVGVRLAAALRTHRSCSPELASIPLSVFREVESGDELCQAVALVEGTAARLLRLHIDAREFGALACRFLLERVASVGGRRNAEYFTPPEVARVMVALLDPRGAERICDPCCGSGELLVAAAAHARERDDSGAAPVLHGLALGEHSRRQATLNAAVHGLAVDLRSGDPLRENEPVPSHDVVLTNPLFNKGGWSNGDPAKQTRWRYGAPPAHNSNFAWLQHVVSMLAEGGRAAVVMPDKAATADNDREKKIRAAMVEDGVVRCVIKLPPRLFRETPIPTSIWLLGAPAGNEEKEVLLVDASSDGKIVGRKYRVLTEEDFSRIVGVYRRWLRSRPGEYAGEAGFAVAVTLDEVRTRSHQLNPGAYLVADPLAADLGETKEIMRDLCAELAQLHDRAKTADATVDRHLERIQTWKS